MKGPKFFQRLDLRPIPYYLQLSENNLVLSIDPPVLVNKVNNHVNMAKCMLFIGNDHTFSNKYSLNNAFSLLNNISIHVSI